VPASEIPATWPALQKGLKSIRDKADPDLSFDLINQRLTDSEAFLFLTPEGFSSCYRSMAASQACWSGKRMEKVGA